MYKTGINILVRNSLEPPFSIFAWLRHDLPWQSSQGFWAFKTHSTDSSIYIGIGKTMLDRILAATVQEYHLKEGSKFISPDYKFWTGACFRPVKTLLFNILHHEGDENLEWKKKWIESYEFISIGMVPNIGYKFGKP